MATKTVTATEAKNEFGRLLDTVMQGEAEEMTCWVLDEATNQFKMQEILGTVMNDE